MRRALLAALPLALACALPRVPPPPLRVGTSGDYAPFSLERHGGIEGLDLDVARLFARDLGRRLEIVTFHWPDLERDLAAGRFDLAMGGVTVRPERALGGSFTRPIVETGAVVLVPAGSRPTLAALDHSTVRLGVNGGGHLERVARRLLPHAALVLADDNRALPALLLSGRADALLTDDVEARLLAASVPGAARIGPLTRDRKAYLGRDPDLIARLDAWMRVREADGTLAALRARWLGPEKTDASSAFDSDLEALLALLDLRLALMPAVAAAKEAAGLPIEDPAQEERVLAAARGAARSHGLAEDAVEDLFRVQIEVARCVQQAFLDTPPAARPPTPLIDLEHRARPALAGISEAIVARAADVARDSAALSRVDRWRMAEHLDASVPLAARLAITGAIAALRMVPGEPTPAGGRM